MNNTEIQNKVNNLRELRRMAEELDAEITAIQDSIKEYMTVSGVEELAGTDYKITWKVVASSRLDTAALRKAMPEVADQFTRSSSTRRFCVE